MTGQNTSSAVMQQRIEAHDSLDDFPTPPWATRALIRHVLGGDVSRFQVCAEPCANRGYMVRPLAEAFGKVIASDIFDYGVGYPVRDYLFPGPLPPADWTIFNPPFRLGPDFILRSFATPGWQGTAALVRSSFIEGQDRYEGLYLPTPPTFFAPFVERVPIFRGIVRDPNKEYWDEVSGQMRRPSTATSYCWLVWVKGIPPQPVRWIPPCRTLLERPGDYPPPTEKPHDDTDTRSLFDPA